MRKRSVIHAGAATLVIIGLSAPAPGNDLTDPTSNVNVALQWNDKAVSAILATGTPPTVASRALAIVHSAMYDAWAAYDPKAIGSLSGSPARQSAANSTTINKASAVSYAAFRTLTSFSRRLPSRACSCSRS